MVKSVEFLLNMEVSLYYDSLKEMNHREERTVPFAIGVVFKLVPLPSRNTWGSNSSEEFGQVARTRLSPSKEQGLD